MGEGSQGTPHSMNHMMLDNQYWPPQPQSDPHGYHALYGNGAYAQMPHALLPPSFPSNSLLHTPNPIFHPGMPPSSAFDMSPTSPHSTSSPRIIVDPAPPPFYDPTPDPTPFPHPFADERLGSLDGFNSNMFLDEDLGNMMDDRTE
jgi:hypothetical protein